MQDMFLFVHFNKMHSRDFYDYGMINIFEINLKNKCKLLQK